MRRSITLSLEGLLLKYRPFRPWSRIVVASALLFTLAGCRSNVVVLDQQPNWVVEAEQRLKKEPVFDVNQPEAQEDSRPLWGRQPTETASKTQESSTDRKSSLTQETPRTSPSPSLRPETSRSPVAQPEGVSWGETKITVEVED